MGRPFPKSASTRNAARSIAIGKRRELYLTGKACSKPRLIALPYESGGALWSGPSSADILAVIFPGYAVAVRGDTIKIVADIVHKHDRLLEY